MTRKTVYVSAGFLSGLLFAYHLESVYITVVVSLMCALLLISVFLKSALRLRAMLVLCAMLAGVFVSAAYSHFRLKPVEALDGKTVTVEGTIAECGASDSASVIIYGRADGIPCRMTAYISNFSGDIGDSVFFEAEIFKLESTELFDARSYYLPDGIFATASPVGDILIETPKRATFSTILRRYAADCGEKLRSIIGSDTGDLICAMATGDRTNLSDSVRLAINRSGLGHIIAVSGLHVSIACGFIMLIANKLRSPKAFSALLAGGVAVSFVIFSGLEVSAIRAAIMLGVYILSTLFRRRSDPLNTLSLCALVMAVFNPYIIADASFILSVSGVFGVSVLSPFVEDAFKIKSKFGRAFITSLCACISTAPAMMLYFNEISLIAPITNLCLLPVCSFALILALIFVFAGCPVWLEILPKLAGWAIRPVILLCEKISDISVMYLPIRFEYLAPLAITLAFSVLGIYLLLRNKKAAVYSIVACVCIFLLTYSVGTFEARDKMYLDIVASKGDCALLLRKNSECIIIDIEDAAKLTDECEDVLEKTGIRDVRLATADDNGEAAYSAYGDISVSPDKMLLPKDSYILGGSIPYEYLGELTEIRFADAKITLSSGGAIVEYIGKSIVISADIARGGDMNISVFDGVIVIDGITYDGENVINIEF